MSMAESKFGSPTLAGREILVGSQRVTLHRPVGVGRKGTVWQAKNQHGRDRAVKLADPGDYGVDHLPTAELTLGMRLEDYPIFARLEDGERIRLEIDGETVDCVAFVSQWLNGFTLERVLEGDLGPVTTSHIRAYGRAMCEALDALDQEKLAHDDLNFGNVMAVKGTGAKPNDEYSFRVVDLGSLKEVTEHDPVRKSGIDDYRWVAIHLAALHNAAIKGAANSAKDRRFLKAVSEIVRLLLEDDEVVRLRSSSSLAVQLDSAWKRASGLGSRPPITPFEFISAEQIADDQLLRRIFAESAPWLGTVNTRTRQIVTGPRGCGKSMLFRWLSLRLQLSSGEPNFEAELSGFYISSTIEMQNRLSWVGKEQLSTQQKAEIVHFFNLLCLREIVTTIGFVQDACGSTSPLQVAQSDELQIAELVSNAIGGWEPRLFSGVSRLRQLENHLRHEIRESHLRVRSGIAPASVLSDESTLADVTSELVEILPFFASYPIVFLLDDFSVHRVPLVVQECLHSVVFQRTPSHSFKISAEKNGTLLSLESGTTAEQSREFQEIDFGILAVQQVGDSAMREFTCELLDARLTACGYKADAETLLGRSDWGQNDDGTRKTLAQSLREGSGSKSAYHGIECVASLCSGDVSALLMVLERIFQLGKVDKNTTKTISKARQHRAIKAVSTELVEQVRSYYGTGPRMHEFVTEFGRFIADVLSKAHLQSKGVEGTPQPKQIPRIEVDSIAKTLEKLEAVEEVDEVYQDLVRRAILIELDSTRALHKGDTALRLHLRRVFLPSFGAALGKNENLLLTAEQFSALLANPRQQFDTHRKTRVVDSSQKPLDFE